MRNIFIDLGASNLRAIMELDGKEFQKEKIATKINSGHDLVEQMKTIINRLAQGQTIDNILISVCGPVNPQTDVIIALPQLNVEEIDLATILKKEYHSQVRIINDANAASFFEAHRGQGKDYSKVLYITLSSGIGCGFVVNKLIYAGQQGFALELGQTEYQGRILEKTFGGKALEKMINQQSLNTFFNDAQNHNNPLYQDWFQATTTSIANLIIILDPEIVIFGGGLLKSGEYFFQDFNKTLKQKIQQVYPYSPVITISENSQEAPMLGIKLITNHKKIYL